MVPLNIKDEKIIQAIADQGRLPYTKIGQYTHLSKDSVKARLKSLLQRKIILSFIPLVDYSKLKYEFFYIFIKFGALVKKRDIFVTRAKKNGHVVAVTRVIGEYDYELQVLAKDTQQLYATLNELLLPVKKDVSRINVVNASSFYLYSMQTGKGNKMFNYPKKGVHHNYHVDQMDLNILKRLSYDARESFVSLAKAMKTTPENIRYHIKKLIENGIIISFHARTNKHALGLNTYIFLLDILGGLTQKDISFLKEKENIYYIRNCSGQWNIIINFYAENNTKLAETLETIRDHFKSKLGTYELLILLERYKFVPVPEKVALNKNT